MVSNTLSQLQATNPGIRVMPIDDPEFECYGHLISRLDPSEVIARAKEILPETERIAYEPSVAALERPCEFNTAIFREVYGGMPMQVGWCYGKNLGMGGLEYHRGSEVNVCVTDAVFLVGHVQDVEFGDNIVYDTDDVAAFYAPEGTVVEFSPWNLHLAPIHVQVGGSFCTLVYLPKGTNERLPFEVERVGENRLLAAVNKWLIAHPDSEGMVSHGAYPGMIGDDIVINPV